MRVLIVCSGNSGSISPFVSDQVQWLQRLGLDVYIFAVRGKGVKGYLSNLPLLRAEIRKLKPDLIHAHSGMSALLAGLQRKVPVIATFHGSDVNDSRLRRFSRAAMLITRRQIVVSKHMNTLLGKLLPVIPCAVDTSVFYPMDRAEARRQLDWPPHSKIIQFASAYSNPVKNAALAFEAIELADLQRSQMQELSNLSRQEVALRLNAADVALMTSYSEGSPQFIKEALACGTAVVSTPVGDVQELLAGVDGCYISDFNPQNISAFIKKALLFSEQGRTKGPEQIEKLELTSETITQKLIREYEKCLE